MKIRSLFLRAFGPFTNTTLDFSGPANLHIVFGANEAGKSSALRAMADLRYGIHPRSQDDFVHEFKSLLVAGAFEDVAGRAIGLARRKGNKDTLMMANPATGEPIIGAHVSPDVLLALTGGVAREQFETMYGLDSERLRRGGRQLIQGEGDLGAALFEASTGSANIKAMVATLQADAKKYFAPRGQTMLLNEAARHLEEAKQRYKQAVTKPDQWKTLNRAHEEAAGRLAYVRKELEAQRRRLGELTELRAVEPLLRQLDQAAAEWNEVEGHVALAVDARELRLAAVQKQTQAEEVLAEVEAALFQCRSELADLTIEPLLVTHATTIERVEADMSLARRERDKRVRLEAATDSDAQLLTLQAQRMVGVAGQFDGLDALYALAPSAADQAQIERLLGELQRLTQNLQHARTQLNTARAKLAQLQRDVPDAPAPEVRGELSLALTSAQALGDAQTRLSDMNGLHASEKGKLDQALKDLGLESVAQLASSRWLAPSEVDAYARSRGEFEKRITLDADRVRQIRIDLATQERRHKILAAVGEVVTADTLKQAREVRDQDWRQIRAVFIDEPPPADSGVKNRSSGDGLPAEFERAQSEADRQADLLREGAKRAAEVAETEQRVHEMTEALAGLRTNQATQEQLLTDLDAAWTATLIGLELPNRAAASLREWVALRGSTRELEARLTATVQSRDLLNQQMSDAFAALVSALRGVGRALPTGAQTLSSLVALAATVDREMDAAAAAVQRRADDIGDVEREITGGNSDEAKLSAVLVQCQASINSYCTALFLAAGAPSEAIKARLAEFLRWASDYQLHAEHLSQVKAAQASEETVANDAKALAELMQEPMGENPDAWIDGLVQRLSVSRDAAIAKANVDRRAATETHRRKRAQADLDKAAQALAALIVQAGIADADALPDAESRSDQRRQAQARLKDLTEQLNMTSTKAVAKLRAELVNLDTIAIDSEKQACDSQIARLSADEMVAIAAEQTTRSGLDAVDTSDEAAQAREAMEMAIARYRSGVRPWAQLKLAEALLGEALRRHREKTQGPVVELAGEYFKLITEGRFVRLLVDDDGTEPVLMAQPAQGKAVAIAALSEGTGDQLHLALRLAALEVQRKPDRMMPLVLDDVFITSDDARAANIVCALEKFAGQAQVLVFTHHHHLVDIAARIVAPAGLKVHQLNGPN